MLTDEVLVGLGNKYLFKVNMKLQEIFEVLSNNELSDLRKRFESEVYNAALSDDALLTSIEEFLKTNQVRASDLKSSTDTIAKQIRPEVTLR